MGRAPAGDTLAPRVHSSIRRLLIAASAFAVLVVVGGAGYFALGEGRWSLGECLYMAVITISTVGFAELGDMRAVPGARALTVALILGGVGAIAYMQSALTAMLVEGALGQAFRRNRMNKLIAALSNHVVVAGAGSTGRHVLEELVATKTPFVVIDRNQAHVERLSAELMGGKMLYVLGDATEDAVLSEAGVARASGVVAALTHDKDNLYVTLSARSLNATARIVSKTVEAEAGPKILKAGATSIVNPTMIGGRRMVNELVRPDVLEFLDQMMRDKERNLRLEEVPLPRRSPFAGIALKDTPIRRETRLLVVAVRELDRSFLYNPDPEHILIEGTTLIVMGEADSVIKLRNLVAPLEPSKP
jgi:voltage-gated potassium channel